MNKISHILSIMILGACMGGISDVSANTFSPQDNGDVIPKIRKDKFDGWTEEQYKHYEDSILSKLYPPVVPCRSEEIPSAPIMRKAVAAQSPMSLCPYKIPTYPILSILTSQRKSEKFLLIPEHRPQGQKHTIFPSPYIRE